MTILATDISPDALDIARENAVGHAPPSASRSSRPTCCRRSSWTATTSCSPNLPYVRHDVVPDLPVAASFEPSVALDGGPDGLEVIARLLERLPDALAEGGGRAARDRGRPGRGIVALVSVKLPRWRAASRPTSPACPACTRRASIVRLAA